MAVAAGWRQRRWKWRSGQSAVKRATPTDGHATHRGDVVVMAVPAGDDNTVAAAVIETAVAPAAAEAERLRLSGVEVKQCAV